MPGRRALTVSELTGRIRDLLARNFTDILVEGEISNCHEATSGHIYFTLKDDRSQIRCVCFKQQVRTIKFRPEDGLHVTVRGSVSVYEQRGEYQIYVEHIEPVGLGALQLAFQQLKKRLEAEGLFAAENKKPLPMLPRCIGLITSPTGAAVRDVIRILRRRFHNVHVTLYPVRVQGDGAAKEIVRALQFFERAQSVDVLILARGGGSLEDLWSFNEEEVARAIFACSIPIISGVGHETDFTIADFVADVRASTPSAAAELVVQTRREFDKHIADLRESLASLIRYRILESSRRVHELAGRRGFRRPLDLLRQQRQRADQLTSSLARSLRANLERSRKRFARSHVQLAAFDFRAKISRLHIRLERSSRDLSSRVERLFRRRTQELSSRLSSALRFRFEHSRRRFNAANLRIASFDLRAKIGKLQVRLDRNTSQLALHAERTLRVKRERLERLRLQLAERSPGKVLERGYAIATDAAGNILRDAAQIAVGETVAVRLHQGTLTTEVKGKNQR
jgi:exodeoxyribonuclease VII large subunit